MTGMFSFMIKIHIFLINLYWREFKILRPHIPTQPEPPSLQPAAGVGRACSVRFFRPRDSLCRLPVSNMAAPRGSSRTWERVWVRGSASVGASFPCLQSVASLQPFPRSSRAAAPLQPWSQSQFPTRSRTLTGWVKKLGRGTSSQRSSRGYSALDRAKVICPEALAKEPLSLRV